MEDYREKLSIFQRKAVTVGELSESYVDYKPQGKLQPNSDMYFLRAQ